ncbi:GTP-binding protein [Sphingomonas sp.]|uniref:GTP-binding protein n=1 Tax=Sphingomonas sp. TaxID=28214 RepID=UPI002DD62D37|nr:GTP-binding protein [Sphingomonas sp.]
MNTNVSDTLKALDNPTRLANLGWLKSPRENFPGQEVDPEQVGVCVSAIQERVGLSQSTVPRARWPRDPDLLAQVEANWDPAFGDRRQELVFIGIDLDRAAITAALDACLIPALAFTPRRWVGIPDPFPRCGAAA